MEAWRDGRRVELDGQRVRVLLALLLVNAGRIVPKGRLVDGIWGESAPAGAPNAVQALVSRLVSRDHGAPRRAFTNSWGVYEGLYEGQPNHHCAVDRGQPVTEVASVQNGCLPLSRERLLARVRPRAVGRHLITYGYDPSDGGFTLQAVAPAGHIGNRG